MKPSRPAARLLAWRTSTGQSRAEVATRLHCVANMVQAIETGARMPGRSLANAIERATESWAKGPIKSEEWDEAERRQARARVA